jgi:hypothetical protein
MMLDLTTTSLRWLNRRSSWRPLREPFDPTCFAVEPLPRVAEARRFIEAHHYSRSFPVALACYGLFERLSPFQSDLAGVAVFSVPIQPRAGAAYGAGDAAFCDLGRFLLLDRIGSNAETWFLARALRQLQVERPSADGGPSLVIAYSDPMPRTDRAGQVHFNGHFGGIYRDSSALYLGRTRARRLWLADDGTVISDRALSKLRNDETGAGYAYETIVRYGAPRRAIGEENAAYVARALSEGPFRSMRHRGNHIFCFPLGGNPARREMRRKLHCNLQKPTRTDGC